MEIGVAVTEFCYRFFCSFVRSAITRAVEEKVFPDMSSWPLFFFFCLSGFYYVSRLSVVS